jgi:hypothetical protein
MIYVHLVGGRVTFLSTPIFTLPNFWGCRQTGEVSRISIKNGKYLNKSKNPQIGPKSAKIWLIFGISGISPPAFLDESKILANFQPLKTLISVL